MGTYLSKPVTEKCHESGESTPSSIGDDLEIPVRWSVVDMQGWRKSMEDSHIASTSVEIPLVSSPHDLSLTDTKSQKISARLFGVFDGHGGPEVARFCSLYLVSVLQQQPTWYYDHNSFANTAKVNDILQSDNFSDDSLIGKALTSTFHALDRMIDDPNRRDEILRLRNVKPNPGEARHANAIPPPLPQFETLQTSPSFTDDSGVSDASTAAFPHDDDTTASAINATKVNEETNALGNDDYTKDTDSLSAASIDKDESEKVPSHNAQYPDSPKESTEEYIEPFYDQAESLDNSDTVVIENIPVSITKDDENDDDDDAFEDADSHEPAGIEEAVAERHENPIGDDDENDDVETGMLVHVNESEQQSGASSDVIDDHENDIHQQQAQNSTAGKVGIILQRLLNLSGQSAGQVVLQMGGARSNTPSSQGSNITGAKTHIGNSNTANNGATVTVTTPSVTSLSSQPAGTPSLCSSTEPPSIVRNGQMICNLRDHAIHAGATAIVAVIAGRTLTIANAGDSRAVLCRGGEKPTTIALSLDHKPMQERELTRIRNAGGFVNAFGRVNGNLNLSRSIGDLKYKQVASMPPEKQIITAHPDIKQIELTSDDEFIILGCDGIWDCLTNEKAVEYVMERINTKSLTDIGIEMLNFIISDDPRITQGIGGDNMTILIVDLQPHKRNISDNPALEE